MRAELGCGLGVQRALQVIVDLAVKVNLHIIVSSGREAPRDYRSSFAPLANLGILGPELAAALEPPAGLRNVLVHEYVDIDDAIVSASCDDAVTHYGAYVDAVAVWLTRRPG